MSERKERSDPQRALREFEQGLAKQPGLPRASIFKGDERWFRERALERVRARALELGWELCQHSVADPDFSLAALVDDLTAQPMFAGARFVLLRGTQRDKHDLLAKDGNGQPSALTRALLARLSDAGLEGGFAISADALRADHALAKAVLAAGGPLLDCRRLYDSPAPWNPNPLQVELVQWVLAQARDRRLPLAPEHALALCARIGNDLFALEQALARIASQGLAALHELAPAQAGASPWNVAGEIARGELARALLSLESMLQAGFEEKDGKRTVDPTALVAMLLPTLVREARAGLVCASALARGADAAQAAEQAGLTGHPQIVAQQLERAKARAPQQWQALLEDALALERRFKTGGSVGADELAHLALKHRARAARR